MKRLLSQLLLMVMLAWPLTAMATEKHARQTGLACSVCHILLHVLHVPGNRLPDRSDPGALALEVET
jgi:hypothetical protein